MTQSKLPDEPQPPPLLDDEMWAHVMEKGYQNRNPKRDEKAARAFWQLLQYKTIRKRVRPYHALALAACLVLAMSLWWTLNPTSESERLKSSTEGLVTMPSELSVIEASGAAVVDKTILPFGQTVHLSLAANTEGFAFVFMQSPSVKGTVIWQGAVGIKPQILMKDPLKDVIGIPLMEAGDYSFCSIAAPTLEALTMLRDILNRGIQQPDLQVALSCLKIKVTEPL